MTDPLTSAELEAIRERVAAGHMTEWRATAAADAKRLLAEVDRLRKENIAVRAASKTCIYGHAPDGYCRLGYPGCACVDDSYVAYETYGDGVAERRENLIMDLREQLRKAKEGK